MPTTTMLITADRYLKTGAHIGTRYKTGEMKRFIYKQRPDGLKVLDLQTLDKRIKTAGQMTAKYPAERVIVVSRKLYGQQSAISFAKAIGAQRIVGRFVPGTFTNPDSKTFKEPALLIATESDSDMQAIEEAARIRVPVISLCSTNNTTKNVDLAIPVNNKGRKSLALVFWLLARETLKEKGAIKSDEEYKENLDDYEYKLPEHEKEEFDGRQERGFRRKGMRDPRQKTTRTRRRE